MWPTTVRTAGAVADFMLILTLVAKIGFTWRLGRNSFCESVMRRHYEGFELSRRPLVFTCGMDFSYW